LIKFESRLRLKFGGLFILQEIDAGRETKSFGSLAGTKAEKSECNFDGNWDFHFGNI